MIETQKQEETAQTVAQAEEARKAEEARQAQEQATSGYSRDARGRWHRPNGQYASKAEIAATGLPW